MARVQSRCQAYRLRPHFNIKGSYVQNTAAVARLLSIWGCCTMDSNKNYFILLLVLLISLYLIIALRDPHHRYILGFFTLFSPPSMLPVGLMSWTMVSGSFSPVHWHGLYFFTFSTRLVSADSRFLGRLAFISSWGFFSLNSMRSQFTFRVILYTSIRHVFPKGQSEPVTCSTTAL